MKDAFFHLLENDTTKIAVIFVTSVITQIVRGIFKLAFLLIRSLLKKLATWLKKWWNRLRNGKNAPRSRKRQGRSKRK